MKNIIKHENLPFFTLICGGFGLALRLWHRSTANDLGFLQRGHLSIVLLVALSAVFLAVLLLMTRDLKQGGKYRFNFPASQIGGFGAIAAAIGFALSALPDLFAFGDLLKMICALLGIFAAGALLFVGDCRRRNRRPNMLFHVLICVYLMLRLICMYRNWSADPQLTDYCFQLFAIICAMLAAYQRAAFDIGMGKRMPHAFFSLAGVYFCCISLAGPQDILVNLAMGIWLITDLCNLRPMGRGGAK